MSTSTFAPSRPTARPVFAAAPASSLSTVLSNQRPALPANGQFDNQPGHQPVLGANADTNASVYAKTAGAEQPHRIEADAKRDWYPDRLESLVTR